MKGVIECICFLMEIKYMSFPKHDKYWTDTIDFIVCHIHEGEKLIAPVEFSELLGDKVINYSVPYNDNYDACWVVIHKGRLEEIEIQILRHIHKFFISVYANEVFVIFSNHKDLPEISSTSSHIKSYWENIKKGQIYPIYPKSEGREGNLFIRKIRDTPTIFDSKKYRECIYLGDYKALTRTIFGHKIFVDTRDMSMAPHILLDGYWEMWVTDIFMNLVKDGMNVIDIGANIGYYSLIFASKIGSTGKLFTFEADPEVFDILHKNMEINGFLGRTELINKAVVDKRGTINFNKCKIHHGSSSIASFSSEFWDNVEIINVETISLDEYFKNKNMKIDIIKIDAEGSEPYIFDGMKELIEKNPNMTIICEFNQYIISGAKRDPRKFLEEIKRYGFTLKYIDDSSNIENISIEELLKKDLCELYLERMKM